MTWTQSRRSGCSEAASKNLKFIQVSCQYVSKEHCSSSQKYDAVLHSKKTCSAVSLLPHNKQLVPPGRKKPLSPCLALVGNPCVKAEEEILRTRRNGALPHSPEDVTFHALKRW